MISMRLIPVVEQKLSIRQEQELLCTVCDGSLINRGPQRQEVELFGSVPSYTYCPKCFRKVGDDRPSELHWRNRVDRYHRVNGLCAVHSQEPNIRAGVGLRPEHL